MKDRSFTMLTIVVIAMISILTVTVDIIDPGLREALSDRYGTGKYVTWGKVAVYDAQELRKRFYTMDSADSIKLFAGFGAPEPLNVGNNVSCAELNAPSGEICIVNQHLAPYGSCFSVASGCRQVTAVIGWYINAMENAGKLVTRQNARAFMYNTSGSTTTLQEKLDQSLLSGFGDAYHFKPCVGATGHVREDSDFCLLASKEADFATWPEFGRGYYEVMDGEFGRSEGIIPTGQEQWLFDSVYVINVQEQFDIKPECKVGDGICYIARTANVVASYAATRARLVPILQIFTLLALVYCIPVVHTPTRTVLQPPEISVASLSSVSIVMVQVSVYSYYDAKLLPYFWTVASGNVFYFVLICARVAWLGLIVAMTIAKIGKVLHPASYSRPIRQASVINLGLSIVFSWLTLIFTEFESLEGGGRCSDDIVCAEARCCSLPPKFPVLLIPAMVQIMAMVLFYVTLLLQGHRNVTNIKSVTQIERILFGCSLVRLSDGRAQANIETGTIAASSIIASGFTFVSPTRLIRTKDLMVFNICGRLPMYFRAALNVSGIEWEIDCSQDMGKVRVLRRLMAFAMKPVQVRAINVPDEFKRQRVI